MAVKLVLNTASTGIMVRLGTVTGNWMSFVDVTNKKLIDRAIRLISSIGKISYEDSCYKLFDAIEKLAFETEKKLLKNVGLFDVYEGEHIEDGKKSYAVSFILQDKDKTLSDKQIESIMAKLQKNFETRLGAKIRS